MQGSYQTASKDFLKPFSTNPASEHRYPPATKGSKILTRCEVPEGGRQRALFLREFPGRFAQEWLSRNPEGHATLVSLRSEKSSFCAAAWKIVRPLVGTSWTKYSGISVVCTGMLCTFLRYYGIKPENHQEADIWPARPKVHQNTCKPAQTRTPRPQV